MIPKNEDIYDKKRVGAVLKGLRKRCGFHTRTAFQRAAGYSGIYNAAICRVEMGDSSVTMRSLRAYSKVLKMPISEIFREIEKFEELYQEGEEE